MRRKKLQKFAEIKTFANVFAQPVEMRGFWNKKYFKNRGAIVLEIGCGSGNYTLNLSEKFPKKNFIGVDRKGDRVWRGAKTALKEKKKNVAFIRCEAEDLAEYFGEKEISEIWLTFPDPYPKPSKAMKRLVSPRYLNVYKNIIKSGGVFHLKTDSFDLFEYGLAEAKKFGLKIEKKIEDIHTKKRISPLLKILTFYEAKFLKEGRKIYYLKAKF